MNCPLCNGSVSVDDYSQDYYKLLLCQTCGKTTVVIVEPYWIEEYQDE